MSTSLSHRGQARRDALLATARDLLVEEGFDQFVLRRIAAKAEMKLGNLQYYFATRDDLLEAVIRAEFDRDLEAVRLATTVESAEGLKTAARALVRNWTTGAGSIFATMFLLAYHHERFRELNREIYETFYRELGVLLRRVSPGCARRGDRRPGTPDHLRPRRRRAADPRRRHRPARAHQPRCGPGRHRRQRVTARVRLRIEYRATFHGRGQPCPCR